MGGFSNINGDPIGTVINADNVSFDGTTRGAPVTIDGQLLIGSTVTPHIKVGFLTSLDNSITVKNGSGTIDLSAMGVNPSTTVSLYDDFMSEPNVTGTSGDSSVVSQMSWTYASSGSFTGSGWAQGIATSAHPGVWEQFSIDSGSKNCFLSLATSAENNCMVLGGGAITINWIFQLATLSTNTNTYTMYIGLTNVAASPSEGVYFQYTNGTNSGNWQLVCNKGGSATTTSTSVAADNNWHNFQIKINAAGTAATFYMDGVNQGTIATNLPTAKVSPIISCARSAGTIATASLLVDAFYMTQTLTTPR